MSILINTTRQLADSAVPIKRLRYSTSERTFSTACHSNGKLFIKGPIPLEWLSTAASLPGKCLNVALAIQWLAGMSGGKPFKLTAKALRSLNVSDDTACDCLRRLEHAGLIDATRFPGKRAVVAISNPPAFEG